MPWGFPTKATWRVTSVRCSASPRDSSGGRSVRIDRDFTAGRPIREADMAARCASTRPRVRHGTLIPTDLTVSAQRAVSLSIKPRNCSGEAWETVTPSGSRRVANSCDSRMVLSSPDSRAAISPGRRSAFPSHCRWRARL